MQQTRRIARFALAISEIALACALLSIPAGAQSNDTDLLRGTLRPGQVNREAPPEPDASAESRPEDSGLAGDVIPEEQDPSLSSAETDDETAQRPRRGIDPSAPEPAVAAGAEARARTETQRQTQPRRGASTVNPLADRKARAIKGANVRGVRSLEKAPNTAVSNPGNVPVQPGLTVGTVNEPAVVRRARRRGPSAESAFDPVGIRSGAVTLFPSVSTSLGLDSNPLRRSGGSDASLFNRTAIGLRLEGDFGNARLSGDLAASYDAFLKTPEANRPEANGNLSYELDSGSERSFEAALRLRVTTENPTDTNLPVGTSDRGIRIDPGATLGMTQRFGRTSFRLRGTLDREEFLDARLANGTTVSQAQRNATQLGLTLRLAHETSPGFQPFVDLSANRRIFDLKRDNLGLKRSSYGYSARAGVALQLDESLRGEISAGYALRDFDDRTLKSLSGFVAGGNLSFAATPLTTFTLAAETTLEESTSATSSGSVRRSATLGIEHDLLRNLQLNASLALIQSQQDSGATDITIRSGLGAEYRIMPELALTGSYGYERAFGTTPATSYDAHTLLFGLRVQR